jgi:aspartate aminotransferase
MYEKIIYDGNEHISIATLDGMRERTLTFNGLSKAYAMTGWRLGYVAGPKPLIGKMATVHSHAVTCATSFAQAGGVAALEGPQDAIVDMVQAWDRRRRLMAEGISAIKGISLPLPEGAFYAFVDGRDTGLSSADLATKMLDEAHVAVVPGIAFGESGEGHVRMSFATGDDALHQTVERLTDLFGAR